MPRLFLLLAVLLLVSLGADADDWPHPRGGLDGRGVAAAPLADAYELAWSYDTAGPVLASSVVADGVVYTGSEDEHLHAIDAQSGERKWAFPAGALIDASPVVDSGVVFIGTDAGVFYAIDAATGEKKWEYQAGARIAGEAGVTQINQPDGTQRRVVLFGSHDNQLYCLDADTGEKQWAFASESYINCGVCIQGGMVVLGGCDMYVHLIDLRTGNALGKVEIGGEVSGTPALAEGHAYLGHMQNEVVGIDLKRKTVAWRFHDRDFPFAGSPAVAGDTVLIGSRGRRLYAIDRRTGEAKWHVRTHGGVDGAPVIAGRRAVFGSAGGRLSVIDLEQGATRWQYDLGQAISGSPAVTADLLVVGTEGGGVYAFRPAQPRNAE